MLMYNIETITLDDLKTLIASGDDSHDNQLRVTNSGEVFLSQDVVGAENLENIKFRFETFDAGNECVGEIAANDDTLMKALYNAMKDTWESDSKETHIDDFMVGNYKKYV